MTDSVQLQVWSDFLCPWCFVGALRIANLEAEFTDRLAVTWKSYLLQPEVRPKDLERFRNYTIRWNSDGGPGSIEPRTVFNTWGSAAPPTHSVPSAIAGKVAATFGGNAFQQFHLALMKAYFTDNRTISDRAVILDIAESCNIDRTEFDHRLSTRGAEFHKLVFEEMADGVELGVHAAPTVVLNGVLPVPGVQNLDTYRRMIERMLAERR